MNDVQDTTLVGDVVATDFRAAEVFQRYGIDFCCGGRRSIAEACVGAHVDPTAVLHALDALPQAGETEDASTWSIDRLVEHILSTHHEYVRAALPTITRYLGRLREVHGERHPELTDIAAAFDAMASGLMQHMMKEEQVLFPYLRQLAEVSARGCALPMSPFGTVENPIRMMEREHQETADEVQTIRALTDGYQMPADGCTTYRVCMAELARFEADLHRHVHLENNVLFPKGIRLEQGTDARA